MSFIIKLSSYELEVAKSFLYASKGGRGLFIEPSKWIKPLSWTEESGSKGFVGFGMRLVVDAPVATQSQLKACTKGKRLAAAVVAAVIGMASVEAMAADTYVIRDAVEVRIAEVAKQREYEEAYNGLSGIKLMFDDAFDLNNSWAAATRNSEHSGAFDSDFRISSEDYSKDVATYGTEAADWLRDTAQNKKHYHHLLELQEARNEAMARQGQLNGVAAFALNTLAVITSPEYFLGLAAAFLFASKLLKRRRVRNLSKQKLANTADIPRN